VSLPVGGLHYLRQGGTLSAGDHRQDLRALALGSGRGCLPCGFNGLLAGLRAGLGLARFAVILALSAPFFWLAPFFEVAFSGATCPPCAPTVAALSVVSAVVMVGSILICACFAHDD
jgi:hypothetical protein